MIFGVTAIFVTVTLDFPPLVAFVLPAAADTLLVLGLGVFFLITLTIFSLCSSSYSMDFIFLPSP